MRFALVVFLALLSIGMQPRQVWVVSFFVDFVKCCAVDLRIIHEGKRESMFSHEHLFIGCFLHETSKQEFRFIFNLFSGYPKKAFLKTISFWVLFEFQFFSSGSDNVHVLCSPLKSIHVLIHGNSFIHVAIGSIGTSDHALWDLIYNVRAGY